MKVKVKSLSRVWLYVTPWTNLLGSSIHGIFQARILESVAISFSRGSSWPRDWTQGLLYCRQTLYHLSHQEVNRILKGYLYLIFLQWLKNLWQSHHSPDQLRVKNQPLAQYLFPCVFDLHLFILPTKLAFIISGSLEPAHLCRNELDLIWILTSLTELSASFPSQNLGCL